MNKLKFAIIGCGRISYKHIEAIAANSEEAELTSVCDIVLEKAEERANKYKEKLVETVKNVSVYIDYKEMIEKEDIDVVAIATESGYHAEQVLYCLNKGKHVIVEKPMAMKSTEAQAMIDAAAKNKVKLCVCHQNRFNPPIQKLRKAIEEGRFGRLINGTARILWNRDMDYYGQAPWRGTRALDGGALMNQCIHNIDLLQWMMGGEVESVYAQLGTFTHDIEGEDFGALVIRFKNGSIGIVEGSVCVYPKNLEETLSIFGEKGTAVIGGLAVNKIETWRFADDMDSEEEILKEQNGDPDSVYGFGHIPLYKDMIGSVKFNKKPYVDGVEGKKALDIILMAYGIQI